MANSVELIDPIKSLTDLPNGTPEYEKLFIFAELLGERRERSVLTLNKKGGNRILETQLSNTNVNMLGVDFNSDNSKYTTLTTNWTDNETNTTTPLEGFGITKINVTIDSSFIPKVSIEFVDVRGATFFNLGENSPYSLIFDFPPPIFNMTLKGYYGKSLDYDLHLVKHNTKFDSNDGNYYINVEFVARTFAPLSDVPLKFAELASLMVKPTENKTDIKLQESASSDLNNPTNLNDLNNNPKVAPRNIYELVGKLKFLTDELKDIKNTSKESKDYDNAKISLIDGQNIIDFMNSFNSNVGADFETNAKIILKNDGNNSFIKIKDDGGEFRLLDTVNTYKNIIKGSNDSGNNYNTENTKLYLGILTETIRDGNITSSLGDTNSNFGNPNNGLLNTVINNYRKKLVDKGKVFSPKNIKDNTISQPIVIYNYKPNGLPSDSDPRTNYDKYYALNVSEFYIELDKVLNLKKDNVQEKKGDLVRLINDNLNKTLGFKPTIYNIFKVLCDDVDTFFKVLGGVSRDAEIHHNKYFNLIIDRIKEDKSKQVSKKIYPFPLYIETDTTCGVVRKVRRIPPADILENNIFPEVYFVNKFIERMISLKKEEAVSAMKTQIDVNGNNKWIPITPLDSILGNDAGYESPYANIENTKFDSDDGSIIKEVYSRLINRFYIASQFTYGDAFYSQDTKSSFLFFWDDNDLKRDDLIKYIAKSEAINMANSIINDQVLDSLKDSAKIFSNGNAGIIEFYKQIQPLPIYSTIPNNGVLKLSDGITSLYRDRRNPNFQGVQIKDTPPSLRINNENSNNPIDSFLNIDEPWWRDVSTYFSTDNDQPIQKFTTENIPYFPDYASEDSQGNYSTRFLNGIGVANITVFRLNIVNFDSINFYNNIYVNSNNKITLNKFGNVDPAGLYSNSDFSITLGSILGLFNQEIKEFLTTNTYKEETKVFVLASMFGRARSYFSELGFKDNQGATGSVIGNINSNFMNPAVVEAPRFSAYYMGGLIEYYTNPELFQDVKNLLDSNDGNNWFSKISVLGYYIQDDSERVKQLSLNDSTIFNNYYKNWGDTNNGSSGYYNYRSDLLTIINTIQSEVIDDLSDNVERIINLIRTNNYSSINNDMVVKLGILNYSQYTFKNENNLNITYDPLQVTNRDIVGGDESRSAANDTFFTTFWKRLASELPNREKELNGIESDFKSVVNDEDIKTQLYYSFKNISDKWISGIDSSNIGFPLNSGSNDSLIKKFAFVDRAMNPIGDDVIINAESLIEMSKDYDLNMFQVFSRLLSLNGFEFFPLQNFMVFNNIDGNWKDAFQTFESLNQKATPAFVCMYIGGASSTLENSSSSFDNDGILDLEGEGLPDFNNIGDCTDSQEITDSKTRPNVENEAKFKYSEPKAFRVRFAEQNQSFFTNIEIEGREFTETADSLAILSRIAGDGKSTAPVPKGQNMFSTYENRAYSVTITMLGNAMIQPTQYFQLENIPMYSGAYLITKVQHNVTANHMVTIFTGTKVLKFPNPFVKEFATLVGVDSGTSEDTSANGGTYNGKSIVGDLISAKTLVNKNSGIYNNEQFKLKISP